MCVHTYTFVVFMFFLHTHNGSSRIVLQVHAHVCVYLYIVCVYTCIHMHTHWLLPHRTPGEIVHTRVCTRIHTQHAHAHTFRTYSPPIPLPTRKNPKKNTDLSFFFSFFFSQWARRPSDLDVYLLAPHRETAQPPCEVNFRQKQVSLFFFMAGFFFVFFGGVWGRVRLCWYLIRRLLRR